MGSAALDLAGATDATSGLLLRKTGLVFLPAVGAAGAGSPRNPEALRALEADLLGLGYTLSADLRGALLALPSEALAQVGRFVFDTLADLLGRSRPFVPLFHGFPESVPEDTDALYVQRMLAWLFQQPEQPCILCGEVGTVRALAPCAHLACAKCFEASSASACPICHRRTHPKEPFFRPEPRPSRPGVYTRTWGQMTRLSLGTDREAVVRATLQRLLSRATVLRPDELDTLRAFVSVFGPRVLDWLPPRIPVKETLAHLLGTLLRDSRVAGDVMARGAPFLKTATDILRVLVAWAGGNPDLTEKVPLKSPPRPLRRALLHVLQGFSILNLTEDVHRHPGLWKAFAGQLHVFEEWESHPRVALAFAALRGTVLQPGTAFGRVLLEEAGEHPASFVPWQVAGGLRLRFRSWSAQVEAALEQRDVEGALRLLRQRPGELLRRLDHVTRVTLAQPEAASLEESLAATLEQVAPRASPALLLTVASHLRRRHAPFGRRVFFPKGEATHAWGMEDSRPLLPGDTLGRLIAPLERELLRRAERQPPFAQALLDEALSDLLVPFAEKTASRALVAVPRGSVLGLPEGDFLRFFVHWTEPKDARVDLDLSVALYDKRWWLVGLCDYTNLRLPEDAAVHSGDITSGPPPLGGAEFLDVHAPRLVAQGVRYVVPVVFSFNSVSFDRMEDAFAGFMVRQGAGGPHFDAGAVEQRFDLQGNAKISVPLVIDLAERRMRWVDVKIPPEGRFHSVRRSRGALACLGKDTTAYFGTGARPTLWELACLHAAARTRTVHVRRRDGRVSVLVRGPDEDAARFLRRLRRLEDARDTHALELGAGPVLFAGLTDAPSLPAGSEGYALRFRHTSAEQVKRLAAGDLVSALRVRG